MIKYWSTLITVSGISPSAKLSSLHGNKRRVKLVRASKQKSVYFFFFLSWMQLRTNNWFQTETYFILFEEMEVPICRMTCLSAQILLHRKSPPIMMAASEIAFFSPNLNPKQEKITFSPKPLGLVDIVSFVFLPKSFSLFSVSTFATKIFPLGFDLCTFLLMFIYFYFIWNMRVCTHTICTGWRD